MRISVTNFMQTQQTAEIIPVQTYIPVCRVTNQHYNDVCAIVIPSAFRHRDT